MNFERSLPPQFSQHTPLRNKRTKHLLNREDSLNISPIFNETSVFKTLNDTSLRQVLDESSMLVGSGNAGDNLNEAFFEIIQTSRPSDILDTLARLGQVCCDSLELVESWNRYNAQNYWLAEEANTWKLLHCLYADSINEHPSSLESIITEPTLSQQNLVSALYQSDSELRLLQLLVDWLEATAAFQEETSKSSAPVIGNNVHWGNTLHQLLIGSTLFNKENNKSMITCMDPDAPKRQKKVLHSDDQQDDNDLCKRIFTEVRCGKFKEAVSLCLNAGQAWRGAVLQGWRLLHYLPREESLSLEIAGNQSRDLWKWCALGLASSTTENVFYRATVGILCGYLPSALNVCHENWEDLLWAHLKVQIEARVDIFLREHYVTAQANSTPSDVLELLESELSIEEMSLQKVFSAVNALMNGKKETHYQTCQKHIMLGHIRSIMQDALVWVESADDKFIRFLAHLILILRQMGKDPLNDIGNTILEKYVCQLLDTLLDGSIECPELIAYYTSTVPNERQIVLYSDFLDHIHKKEFRSGVVKAGLNAGIDVAASARLAIKKAIKDIQQDFGSLNTTQTTAVEKDKSLIAKVISSLEWLALVSNQIEEALWLSNAMIRTFIFMGCTDAASLCLVSLNQMFPSFVKQLESNSSALREHLCLKAYLEALDSFATWQRNFISGQPKDVEPLPSDATFADKVHHEHRCNKVKQQFERWSNAVLHQSRHTKDMLYNVLLFPGGWLMDESDHITSPYFTADEKHERNRQLETLRRLCVPEVTLLILKILQSTEDVDNHKEALKLSVLIAGENRCLYKIFTQDKIVEVLDSIKESSLLLLKKGKDMFGGEEGEI